MSTHAEQLTSELPVSSAYDRFARAYDSWMAEDFCRRVMPLFENLLLRGLPPAATLLDLCCGTGRIAGALGLRGYNVTGIDSSDWMLRLARENAPAAQFICADARDFTFPQPFDGALCAFNSLAHMRDAKEVSRVFASVNRALKPGAPFVFDLSMRDAYLTKWQGALAHVTEDSVCVIRPEFDDSSHTGTNRITLLELECGTWRRTDLDITQKCHSQNELCTLLQRSGFHDIAVYDAERDLKIKGEYGRAFFLCRSNA